MNDVLEGDKNIREELGRKAREMKQRKRKKMIKEIFVVGSYRRRERRNYTNGR